MTLLFISDVPKYRQQGISGAFAGMDSISVLDKFVKKYQQAFLAPLSEKAY